MNSAGPVPGSPGLCAQLACILEVSAEKAGNVTPRSSFEDSSCLDFLLAAAAIAAPLDAAAETGVGRAVLECVERARRVSGTNANLGLVLLLAPLAAAAGRGPGPLDRRRVREVLDGLGPADGDLVYRAIRLAGPGGLGAAEEEDVGRGPPARPLVEAMTLAAGRDLVARQYSNGFGEVFDEGLPGLQRDLGSGLSLEQAIVRCHLGFMARHPDSLIRRKCGEATAREAADRAAEVLAASWPGTPLAGEVFQRLDRWLRADGHRRNPGTSADLVGASLFPAIVNGIIRFPFPRKS